MLQRQWDKIKCELFVWGWRGWWWLKLLRPVELVLCWCEGCSRIITPGHFWCGQELGHKTNSMSSLCTSNKNYKKILFSLTLTFRRKHKKSSNISFLEQREQRYNQDKWLFPTFWQKGNRTLNIHFLICQWSIPIDRLFTSFFHWKTSKLPSDLSLVPG